MKRRSKRGSGSVFYRCCHAGNCRASTSQLFANLMDKYGAPDPSVIQPGAMAQDKGFGNFEPPQPAWNGSPNHRGYPSVNR